MIPLKTAIEREFDRHYAWARSNGLDKTAALFHADRLTVLEVTALIYAVCRDSTDRYRSLGTVRTDVSSSTLDGEREGE